MVVEVLLLLLLLLLIYKVCSKPKGLPPGVWGWPILGALPYCGFYFSDYLKKLKQKYGDIFTVKLGNSVMVIVSDYQLIKTAMNNPLLQGRPDFYSFRLLTFNENLGLAFSEGQVWQNGRRFALRHLKDFGMGSSNLEVTIELEVFELLKQLDTTAGKPTKLERNLNVAILNVIWSLVAARRYDINDPELVFFQNLLEKNFEIIQGPVVLLDQMPWLISITPDIIKKKWMGVEQINYHAETIYAHLKKIVEEHKATLDRDAPRDYIDTYLIEAEEQKDNPDSTFRLDYKDLLVSMADLFVAGSETTSSTLRWACLLLALNPDVQKKVQQEMDNLLPRDVLPALQHKDQLPYLEATICEIQRFASLVPVGVFHAASEDTTLAGYTIPKGTLVGAYQESCHRDKKYFERPDELYPQHFLDDNGKFISKKEGFLPFNIGRRQCLGESVAKMELFLFISAILHRFTITPPPGVTLTTETNKTQPIFNFTLPFSVVFTKRATT